MQHGFLYLTAVMDLFSRNVLSWRLSNTLTGDFCVEALYVALSRATPEIFSTDQGAKFTATAFTGRLVESGVAVSMHERGRALDSVFFERLWRTVKEEEVYLREYTDGWQAGSSGLTQGLLRLLLQREATPVPEVSNPCRGVLVGLRRTKRSRSNFR